RMRDAGAAVNEPPTEAPAAPEPVEPAPVLGSGPADIPVREARDTALAAALEPLVRAVKRRLREEHNELLDALRHWQIPNDPKTLLPDATAQREGWGALVSVAVSEVYAAGRASLGTSSAPGGAPPTQLVDDVVGVLVTPLREQLEESIGEAARE